MERSAQFTLSLIGGMLILAGGIVSLIWFLVDFSPAFDPLSELREDMGQEEFKLFQIRYTIAGLSTGIAVIITSSMLKFRPEESRRWGIMIIVLSGMSILGMGGFIAGMVLGIIGGVIAIVRRGEVQVPEKKPEVASVETAQEKPVREENMIFRCSSCDITFRTDEDLRGHIIRIHTKS